MTGRSGITADPIDLADEESAVAGAVGVAELAGRAVPAVRHRQAFSYNAPQVGGRKKEFTHRTDSRYVLAIIEA